MQAETTEPALSLVSPKPLQAAACELVGREPLLLTVGRVAPQAALGAAPSGSASSGEVMGVPLPVLLPLLLPEPSVT